MTHYVRTYMSVHMYICSCWIDSFGGGGKLPFWPIVDCNDRAQVVNVALVGTAFVVIAYSFLEPILQSRVTMPAL
jgi:hypothetical protein